MGGRCAGLLGLEAGESAWLAAAPVLALVCLPAAYPLLLALTSVPHLQLATLVEHPESVPINALVAVKGTPMQDNEAPTGALLPPACLALACLLPAGAVWLPSACTAAVRLAGSARPAG